MDYALRYLFAVWLLVGLSGCLLPIAGSTIPMNQEFTILTPNPNQQVRLNCSTAQLVATPPTYQLLPSYSSVAELPASNVFLTGSTPVDPASSYPLYAATFTSNLSNLLVSSPGQAGCWTTKSTFAYLKPKIRNANGQWEDWIVLDQDGWDCVNDDSRHNDSAADPDWYSRGLACSSGPSGVYNIAVN
jgi:hypothetical protein